MPPVICDTDILSESIKSVDATVVRRAKEYIEVHGVLTFTSATVMEILYGFHRKSATLQAARVLKVLDEHREIVQAQADFRLAAQILGALDRRGTPIGRIDPLIAACALNRNMPLATGNVRRFRYIQEAGFPLLIEDWRQP